MKKTLTTLALVIGALVLVWAVYALAWPDRFAPVAWQPAPQRSLAVQQTATGPIARRAESVGRGPETVIRGPDGALYTGYADGTVHRLVFAPDGTLTADDVIAQTNGRPLGLAFGPVKHDDAASATLYIADADRGLLAIDHALAGDARAGALRQVTDSAAGTAFRFTDDVAVADDGRIYLTDASSRWPQSDYQSAILEHAGDGRLLVYYPATHETRVLLHGLQFANGIALSRDQRYLLVNETGAYRVRRYWLAGPKKDTSEIVIDGLPGFPDGLSRAPGGDVFWIALFAPRNALLDFASDKPLLRELTRHLPRALQPKAAHVAHVMAIDGAGHVLTDLRGPDDGPVYAPITSVLDTGRTLYFGSLEQPAIGEVPAPEMP